MHPLVHSLTRMYDIDAYRILSICVRNATTVYYTTERAIFILNIEMCVVHLLGRCWFIVCVCGSFSVRAYRELDIIYYAQSGYYNDRNKKEKCKNRIYTRYIVKSYRKLHYILHLVDVIWLYCTLALCMKYLHVSMV